MTKAAADTKSKTETADRMASLARDLDLQALDEQLASDEDDFEDPRQPRWTREMKTRKPEKKITWRPANQLPDPPQMDGWRHRWIRVAHENTPDNTNMNKALREGWRPAPAQEYPDLVQSLFGRGDNVDHIEFGGLVLCRLPEDVALERQRFFDSKAKRQLNSIQERAQELARDDRIQFTAQTRREKRTTPD